MARVAVSTDVSAAPEAIWELMSAPDRYPEYVDATDRMIDVPDEDVGVGYRYREYGGIRPFVSESEWVVTEFEPTRR
ncbi:MAG: SRPBCC family protein [Actinobacteria bacterium]|nr:SRPBCC family protein [Actinomycetota bacterium]